MHGAIILYLFVVQLCHGAVMHTHASQGGREREADGAYSPRDRDHLNGESHNSEFDHEAILGSARAAEEFDHLTPEESKRRLEILLRKMDLNKDGFISKAELSSWILRSLKSLSEEEAAESLEDADEDGDGKVSWKEYLSENYDIQDDGNTLDFSDQMHDDKNMWNAADFNNDGFLTGNEWLAFTHPEEHPVMLPKILEQTLKEKDKNKDGAIDFKEYIADRGESQDIEWIKVEKIRFDKELDKDKDGKLTGNEILSWVVPSNEEIAEEESQHLLISSDDDQDGILSFDEILDKYDLFVGSEATDYGEHINNIHQFSDEL